LTQASAQGEACGFLPLDKPVGPTSHDAVARARRALGVRQVGHSGTLDPFASGLLILAVGPATRLLEYLSPLSKVYEATLKLGVTTETLDPEGEEREISDAWKDLGDADLRSALASFEGVQDQVPPRFSAKKVGGLPAHRRVRAGEEVSLPPARIQIHQIELVRWDRPNLTLRVRCSTGTYIRALARDVGDRLGTGAYLTALRRTGIGPISVDSALKWEGWGDSDSIQQAWLNPPQALVHLEQVEVDAEAFRRLCLGQAIAGSPLARVDLAPDPHSAPDGRRLGETRLVTCSAHPHRWVVARQEGEQLHPQKVVGSHAG